MKLLSGRNPDIVTILIVIVILYGIYVFVNYLLSKSPTYGTESNSTMNSPYKNTSSSSSSSLMQSGSVQPSPENIGQPIYGNANGIKTSMIGLPSSCSPSSSVIQNPNDLLPKSSQSGGWSSLNPSGEGELKNINLLKAGANIGINTVNGSLRNANLQIRSEPPNPQLNLSIWNQSTIQPDYMRPPLEIGSGMQ